MQQGDKFILSNEIVVHKIIRNKIYSTNAEDVVLCLKIVSNVALLQIIPRVFTYNYKINKSNEIYIMLRENGITMEVSDINYGNQKLITFYKNGEKILESEHTFHYITI